MLCTLSRGGVICVEPQYRWYLQKIRDMSYVPAPGDTTCVKFNTLIIDIFLYLGCSARQSTLFDFVFFINGPFLVNLIIIKNRKTIFLISIIAIKVIMKYLWNDFRMYQISKRNQGVLEPNNLADIQTPRNIKRSPDTA